MDFWAAVFLFEVGLRLHCVALPIFTCPVMAKEGVLEVSLGEQQRL